MKERWNKYKVAIIAAGLVLFMAGVLGAGIGWSHAVSGKDIVEAAEKEVENADGQGKIYYVRWDDDALYKEYKQSVGQEDIAKQVCSKFGLDYDTVTLKEITREMSDYGEALTLLGEIGDCPLYAQNAEKRADGTTQQSLEMYICDIYAFSEGRTVIGEYCRRKGIDPDKTVVSDLSVEELIEIGQKAYETSDHGTEAEEERIGQTLYKEHQWDEELAKQVCEIYNLDYDTVTVKELTRDMQNYEEALWIRKYIGKSRVYEEDAQREGNKVVEWTLEAYIRDTNDFPEAKSAIEEVCREKEINPDTAIVSDFTVEDLVEIIGRAYTKP